MHVIIALDASLAMFKKAPNSNQKYIDIAVESIEHFIDYTSDMTHNKVNEIALVTFSKDIGDGVVIRFFWKFLEKYFFAGEKIKKRKYM